MKTIKQKAKAYDEALDRAKVYWETDNDNTLDIKARGTMEHLFPELREGGDEIIKEELINYLKHRCNSTTLSGEERACNKWIDWLEKQDSNLVENGYTDNKDVIKYANKYSHEIWHKLMDNFKNIKDYHIGCNDVSDIVLNAIIDTYNWLKKPINKPKFHEGDFIKHNKANVIYKVISVNSGSYYIENIDTNSRIELFHVEQNFHLWSIDDAKDGDILYSPKHNLLWIYKNKGKYHAAINLNYANPISFDSNIVIPSDVCPAIKEQCNFLLQKMSEAGYIVDFKKKKLRKLKFKVGDEVITENEESLTITRIDKEGYWSNDLFICNFDDECIWDLVKPYGQRKECLDCQFNYAGECKGSCAMKRNEQNKPKFKVGDIISNGKVVYRVDNIVKNCIGQDCYFLVNIEYEKKGMRYYKLYDSEGKTSHIGEITWICEQVDRQFWIKED